MPLYQKQIIEIGKIRTMQRDLVKIDGLKDEIDANVARVKGQISKARIKIISSTSRRGPTVSAICVRSTASRRNYRSVSSLLSGHFRNQGERSYSAVLS